MIKYFKKHFVCYTCSKISINLYSDIDSRYYCKYCKSVYNYDDYNNISKIQYYINDTVMFFDFVENYYFIIKDVIKLFKDTLNNNNINNNLADFLHIYGEFIYLKDKDKDIICKCGFWYFISNPFNVSFGNKMLLRRNFGNNIFIKNDFNKNDINSYSKAVNFLNKHNKLISIL